MRPPRSGACSMVASSITPSKFAASTSSALWGRDSDLLSAGSSWQRQSIVSFRVRWVTNLQATISQASPRVSLTPLSSPSSRTPKCHLRALHGVRAQFPPRLNTTYSSAQTISSCCTSPTRYLTSGFNTCGYTSFRNSSHSRLVSIASTKNLWPH